MLTSEFVQKYPESSSVVYVVYGNAVYSLTVLYSTILYRGHNSIPTCVDGLIRYNKVDRSRGGFHVLSLFHCTLVCACRLSLSNCSTSPDGKRAYQSCWGRPESQTSGIPRFHSDLREQDLRCTARASYVGGRSGTTRRLRGIGRWVTKFTNRHNFRRQILHGEVGSVENAAIASRMVQGRAERPKYDAEHIFNADETGLLYKLQPKRSCVVPTQDKMTVPSETLRACMRRTGSWLTTYTLMAYICTNATGSQRFPWL